MGLSCFFTCPETIESHRLGILGQFQDGFCDWLINQQYSASTIYNYIPHITHLSCFLRDLSLEDIEAINASHIEAYFNQRFPPHYLKSAGYAYRCFLVYLKTLDIDLITPEQPLYQALIEQYRQWCQHYKGLSPQTIHLRCQYLIKFIEVFGANNFQDRLSLITPKQVQSTFLAFSKDKGVSWRRSMAATLKSFFQFCYKEGLTKQLISAAIPGIRTYRLATIPKGISEKEAKILLASVDRTTYVGKRNYALLIMLYYYGIRGAQLRALTLQDIDWQQETLYFSPIKSGNSIRVPLFEDVGNALLDYIRHARVKTDHKEVFLTATAPYHPLYRSSNIGSIISDQLRKTKLDVPSKGSHLFRHGFATRMVNKGYSLKAIADVLGHKCIQTTQQYSKVDFISLSQVPLEFPM